MHKKFSSLIFLLVSFTLLFSPVQLKAYQEVPMEKSDFYLMNQKNFSYFSKDGQFKFKISEIQNYSHLAWASYLPFKYKFPTNWKPVSFVLDLDNPDNLAVDIYIRLDQRINNQKSCSFARKRVFRYNGSNWEEYKTGFEIIDGEWVKITANIGGLYVLLADDLMEVGDASWYKYKNCMCAASPDYPKGTKLLVKDLDSGKSIVVEVNDWGPERDKFPSRVIDLDAVAFEALGWDLSVGVLHNILVQKIEE